MNIYLEEYNKYELCAYIDRDCSVCFAKISIITKFMSTKTSPQARIVDNCIMSHNEAIEGLSIEVSKVQCIIIVMWDADQIMI